MGEKNNLVLVVGAIAAFVLQIALAPAVALFSGAAELPAGLCAGRGHRHPHAGRSGAAVCHGLAVRPHGHGPGGRHGPFAGHRVLFGIARVLPHSDNDTLFMPLAIFVACALLAELVLRHAAHGMRACRQPSGGAVHPRAFRARCTTAPWAWWSYSVMARLLASGAQDRGLRTPKLR